jgi:cell filamentation protein
MEHLPRQTPLIYEGYRHLHRHIFEPVYTWAGKERTVNIGKGSSLFCLAPHITNQMKQRFAIIQADNGLRGLTRERFAARVAEHICEINAIHPSRDGNGRTQRAFLERFGTESGHPIALARIDPLAWNDASIDSFRKGDYDPMGRVILTALAESLTGNSSASDGIHSSQ